MTDPADRATVLDRLREAFPTEDIGPNNSNTDYRFRFGQGAMIFVRTRDPNIARIEVNWSHFLSAFPNEGRSLREVVNDPALGVRPHVTRTKVECLFGPDSIDRLIEALRA